jgi:hypothetical protein
MAEYTDTHDLPTARRARSSLVLRLVMVWIELPRLPQSVDEARKTPDWVDGEGGQNQQH